MLIKLAWRNIWRNPRRSLVMIFAVMIGLWAGVFVASITTGLMEQRFRTSIQQQFSHIQMHNPDYLKENNVVHRIDAWESLGKEISENENVKAFTMRTLVSGMIASSNLTTGIKINGIDPEMEAQTTGLNENVTEGSYFAGEEKSPILLGRKLADKMKVRIGSRVVVTFQDTSGELTSSLFRVCGIYQTSNTLNDELNAYVLHQDLNEIVAGEIIINQVALICHDLDSVNKVALHFQSRYSHLTVRTWKEISPELSYMQEMTGVMMTVILLVILLALAFGLLNTILMSVYERIRELGMLMAIGMNKRRIFGMILMETLFITLTGGLSGMLFGIVTIRLFHFTGIDFATVGGDSLNDFGFDSVVYPSLDPSFFFTVTLLTIFTALITSIYPAIRALRLNPSEAIRKD